MNKFKVGNIVRATNQKDPLKIGQIITVIGKVVEIRTIQYCKMTNPNKFNVWREHSEVVLTDYYDNCQTIKKLLGINNNLT